MAATKGTAKAGKPRVSVDYGSLGLDKLQASDAAKMPTGSRSGVLDAHPQFVQWMRESWEHTTERTLKKKGEPDRIVRDGKAKSVTVKSAQVKAVDSILRMAARRLGVGVKIVTGKPDAQGNVVVAFRAQTPKATKARAAK